jgi:hypothetical protein
MNADSYDDSHVNIFAISRHELPASVTPTVADLSKLPPPPAYSSSTSDPDPPPPYSADVAVPAIARIPPVSSITSRSITPSPGVRNTPLQPLPASQASLDLQTRHHESRQQRSNCCHVPEGRSYHVCNCRSCCYWLFVVISFIVLLIGNVVFFLILLALVGKFMDSTSCLHFAVFLHIVTLCVKDFRLHARSPVSLFSGFHWA